MKQRFLALVLVAAGMLACPMQSLAQDEAPKTDVRWEGYGSTVNVKLPPQGSAITYLIMLALAGACVGVMFKNAKRSHLD